MTTTTSPLVTTEWLAEHIDDPNIVIFDCSWHLPQANRNAKADFQAMHIPGAQFFDLDALSEAETSLPHMLPKPQAFATNMSALGVGDDSFVICYDTLGIFSAPRAWWMLHVFGHENVAVLDGGLPKWLAEHRPVANGSALPQRLQHFTARFHRTMVRDLEQMRHVIQIADARSAPRFRGEEKEPRPGVRPGHIPGAHNVHYAALLNTDGTMKSPEAVAGIFKDQGLNLDEEIITSCGSGVTAAILSLGLTLAAARSHALYDGSWAEWGAHPETQAATGA